MPVQHAAGAGLMTQRARCVWAAVIVAAALAMIAAVLVVPFKFESPSMYYKFGADKLLLRAGKLVGLTAALLLFFQLPLAGRLKALDRVFSLPALYRAHRIGAYAAAVLALAHPALVLVPDDMYMIPFQARYWPEWVGAGLLVLILCQVVFSRFRRVFSIRYHRWLWIHRLAGVAVAAALAVHVLYVSETFQSDGPPRTAVFMLAGGWALLWGCVRLQSSGAGSLPCAVSSVTAAGKDAYSINLAPAGPKPFAYIPGQFAFISIDSTRISKEAHPFTLSSTPTRAGALQITVRRCGDWTDRVGALEEGDSVYLQGPFGKFTHLIDAPGRQIVMIAGGIGITPMLSMLRYMRDIEDHRPVTLIWSNRAEEYLFCRQELDEMQQKLTRFTWIPTFTRRQAGFGHFGRVDRPLMEKLLVDTARSAAVYVCGPPEMIREVSASARQIGFAAGSIKQEAFGL
ncbi:MAG: ferric reductase-like transmembrane domain-containing protein [Desulfobacterales bacterium]|nr:ferric reductase-like transmembrane domain-containing protein [Desulfobacterales bacterium]